MSGIGLVMIVKNEEKIITECLKSVVDYINYYTICDTGSTDNTIQVIKDFFKNYKVPGQVLEHEWKGFSHNRSLAFKAAEPHSSWLYVIDADDHLITPLEIPDECADAHSLIIDIEEGPHVTQTRQQIFKSGWKWGYAAVVHEYPYSKTLKDILIRQTHKIKVRASRGGDRSKDVLKYWKDAQLMEQDLLRVMSIPKDKLPHWEENLESRYKYYIAQSYFDFKMFKECIKWCDQRVLVNGFKEEIYRAYLLKGRCLKSLMPIDKTVTFKQVVDAFEKCHRYDPYRSEAVFDLCQLYEDKGDLQSAWEFLNSVLQIKRPKDKFFIIEDFIYEFGKKQRAAIISRKLGNFETAYRFANSLYYECREDDQDKLRYVYGLKHENIPELINIYKVFTPVKIVPNKNKNIVFNLTVSNIDFARECLSSFLATCLDYIDIDKWYYSGEKSIEFEKSFPFMVNGRDTGELITINVDDSRLFFHKTNLIDYIKNISHVKILYIDRNGEDVTTPSQAPRGLTKINCIKKNPYVLYAEPVLKPRVEKKIKWTAQEKKKGLDKVIEPVKEVIPREGIWCVDFKTSISRDHEILKKK